ncbi:RhoGAP-domain-containing protein [Amylocystis lapponica]|nr:RhoGAP-domain-containing protein [Amylocystis lapponica]
MHIYHTHTRNKDTNSAPSTVPPSHSSTSLSSSFSSAASSVLLPAAPPSNSSQSDLATSDRSASSIPTSHKNRFFPLSLSAAAPRSTSPAMGQVYSRTAVPDSPTSSLGAGGKFKRAWAGRRKKSEDITATFIGIEKRDPRSNEREREVVPVPAPPAPDYSQPRPADPSRAPNAARNISTQIASTKLNVFGGKKSAQSFKSFQVGGSTPPPPPPKPLPVQVPSNFPTAPALPPKTKTDDRPIPVVAVSSPVPAPTVRARADGVDVEEGPAGMKLPTVAQDKDKDKMKEDWRKSDSTMTSHVTVRPGALGGNRSPRPVSLAESSHSANTIVPINKRLSALITDAEFATLEESDSSESDQDQRPRPPASGRPSPTSSLRAKKNRRSASLNLGPGFVHKIPATPSEFPNGAGRHSPGRFISDSVSMPVSPLSMPRDTPTLTRTAANGIIAPTSAAGATHSTGSNIRSRLAAWTAASSASSSPAQPTRELPSSPPQPRRPLPPSHPPSATPPSFRQTAVSMTGGLAPAAGFAMGFGKRAVEKVGRAWGGFNSSSSSASGYSSSSSVGTGAPSFSSRQSDHGLRRTSSNQTNHSGVPMPPFGVRKTKRRTAGNASIASSVTSSSASDVDQFGTPGPTLGTRLRGPRCTASGASIAGGLVFRRDLKTCVQSTAIDSVLLRLSRGIEDDGAGNKVKPLEERLLPALVVRCAQHLLRWGVQEEGLFRVSGRSSHVAKLRSEFDAGADFDMVECDPGDLDPHAVASIFKAYLRELPESILTAALIPYFESALAAEERARQSLESTTSSSAEGPSLSTSPLTGLPHGMRKPPSLSTLAVPGFAGKRTVSDSLLNALTWLISQLPRENRDLLYTVVELIKATADNSKETKMPLGNLLLVFCPSLNMNPTLLRVLSEADTIWEGAPLTNPKVEVVDTIPEHVLKPSVGESDADVAMASKAEGRLESTEEEHEGEDLNKDVSEDTPHTPEDHVVLIAPEPTKDEEETSEQSQACSQIVLPSPISPISAASFKDDNASFVSAQEVPSAIPTRSPSPASFSPGIPPLSSSSESLNSPSTMSDEPVSPQPVVHIPAASGKVTSESQDSLVIPEPDLSLLSTPRRPQASGAVPFPTSGGSAPQTPVSRRKSFALLSFPPMRSEPATTSAAASPTWSRPKRPSLHLLFSKKSFSYLTSPTTSGSAQATVSAPSLSPCIQTQPASPPLPISVASMPPKLSTTISSSPIGLGFDDVTTQLRSRTETARSAPTSITEPTSDLAPSPTHLHARPESYVPSVYTTPVGTTPQHTPIADLYQDRSKSALSLHGDAGAVAPAMTRTTSEASQVSTTPSIDLVTGVEDAHEDWAESVLSAAQGEHIV